MQKYILGINSQIVSLTFSLFLSWDQLAFSGTRLTIHSFYYLGDFKILTSYSCVISCILSFSSKQKNVALLSSSLSFQ